MNKENNNYSLYWVINSSHSSKKKIKSNSQSISKSKSSGHRNNNKTNKIDNLTEKNTNINQINSFSSVSKAIYNSNHSIQIQIVILKILLWKIKKFQQLNQLLYLNLY